MTEHTHDYKPWPGELAVQPMRCPCCGGESGVWQYVAKPGADVLRVVMCNAPEFEDDRLPMLLSTCPLNMPHDSFYCQTARSAVEVWNRYGAALIERRIAAAALAPQPNKGDTA